MPQPQELSVSDWLRLAGPSETELRDYARDHYPGEDFDPRDPYWAREWEKSLRYRASQSRWPEED